MTPCSNCPHHALNHNTEKGKRAFGCDVCTCLEYVPEVTAQLVDDLLTRHLDRTGAREASLNDVAAHLQVHVLRDFLRVLQAALADEHIPTEQAKRIIDRLIYGSVPQPAQVALRKAEMDHFKVNLVDLEHMKL